MSAQGPHAERGSAPHSNLYLRVVSALVLGVLVLGAILLGGIAFRLLAAAMAGLVFHEWMHMRPPASSPHRVLAWCLLALALAALVAGLAAPVALAVLAAGVLVVSVHAGFLGLGFWSVWGMAYAGVPAIALSALRDTAAPTGLALVLFLFVVVWATDILAYFVGRAVGGPKLAPAISPGKTWSGAVGGAIGAVLAGTAGAVFFGARPAHLAALAVVALALSVAAQAGDLFESAVKRRHGVKDSGTLIPGHGGVMDRVDGLVAAAVLLYLLMVLYSMTGAAILPD